MHTILPTCTFDSWTVTSLRDSLLTELSADTGSDALQMYFYAITKSGWNEIRKPVLRWAGAKNGRSVTVYVGTDHAITDPTAMEVMQKEAIDVRLMESYRGVFHPKVVWLKGSGKNMVWVGSNNLTKDGLLNNIEFAVLVKSRHVPVELVHWAAAVASGSTELNDSHLRSYKEERDKFEIKRAAAKATTFTWSRKHEPKHAPTVPVSKGDLIVEIMPEETRGGTQVQLPKEAVKEFFGIDQVGDHIEIALQRKGTRERRKLVITVFKNNTVRLSINELEYRDRPCVITFRKLKGGLIVFEIVPENIFPTRYRTLISQCNRQTRAGSRRWTIIS